MSITAPKPAPAPAPAPVRTRRGHRAARLVGGTVAAFATLSVLAAAPAFADDTPAACPASDAHISICNYVQDHVWRFDHPGAAATDTFPLTLDTDEVDHGSDSDGGAQRAPDATLTATSPGWQQVESDGFMTGAETRVTYRTANAPFGPQDQVGYHADIPFHGDNAFDTSGSEYLFANMTAPADTSPDHATTTTVFSDRPLSIQIHDALPGVTLTKVGMQTSGGLVMDPAATDQDTPGATIAPEDGTHSGDVFYGGYRSGTADATFQVTYEVAPPPAGTPPTSPQELLAGTQIHLLVKVDAGDPTKQESTCTVSSPTSLNTVDCAVTQGGSNDGQSTVAFSITKP